MPEPKARPQSRLTPGGQSANAQWAESERCDDGASLGLKDYEQRILLEQMEDKKRRLQEQHDQRVKALEEKARKNSERVQQLRHQQQQEMVENQPHQQMAQQL